ncbi:MAG: uracil phosphoribosyltransferase [Bacteroidota bacterium]
MKNIYELKNNLANVYLTKLRDRNSTSIVFRDAIKNISKIIAAKVFENIDIEKISVTTPLEKTDGYKIKNEIVFMPILRAGEGMLSTFQEYIPTAKIGFIGIARDEETLKPKIYLKRIPKMTKKTKIYILDPMLATGGSICATIKMLKNISMKNITVLSILASPEGIKNISKKYKSIKIHVLKIDRELNDKGYILPGLGDAGDRLYDT